MSDRDKKIFQAVFDNSPVGLVTVNKDSTLRNVNNYMLKTFHVGDEKVEGKTFGNLFNCSAVSGNGKTCGQTDQCAVCGFRKGILSVLTSDTAVREVVMDHCFNIDGTEQRKWFIISASRVETHDDEFAVVSFSDITVQKNYEALLNNQLTLDMATGITNKYALLNALKNLAISRESLTIALIDFDDFKAINDTCGHLAGDKVLNHFCQCAAINTRKQDILGRFGGEEFMMIFPNTQPGLIINALKRIAESLGRICKKELGIYPTFSVGLAEFSEDMMGVSDINAIIAEIDANLYEAKKRGKNMLVIGGISVPFQSGTCKQRFSSAG